MDNRMLIASACTACLVAIFVGYLSNTLYTWLSLWLSSWPFTLLSKHYSSAQEQQWNLLHHLGGNGPWIPKVDGIIDDNIDPPSGCKVDQVHMISRHAERYPTVAAGVRMLALYERIKASNVTFHGDLSFVNDWDFFIDDPSQDLENLVSTGPYAGTLQAFNTGVKLRTRYKHLLDDALTRGPVSFWASDSNRVIDTAKYFAAAFFGIDWTSHANLSIIPETPARGADTLTPGRTCHNYRHNVDRRGHDYGYRMMDIYRSTYEPAIVRRLAVENPGIVFAEAEIFTMQSLCGFETLAKGRSPWCDVFTRTEWEQFEYARDLLHYYRGGPGNPYSRAMGWLWLNATAQLLSAGPEEAGSLFFSFVHDNDIAPLLTALNLFPSDPPLPITHIPHNRTFRTSSLLPMGGRVSLERLSCPREQECWSNAPFYPNHVYCEQQVYDRYVRVNINDGVVRLEGCQGGPGGSCELEAFLGRVRAAGERGEFGRICGVEEVGEEGIGFLRQ